MTAKEMWEIFSKENNLENEEYEVWAFGDDSDKLAELTVNVFVFEDQSLYPSNAGEMLAPEESPQVRKILDRSVPVFTEMVTVPFSVSIIGFSEMIFPLFLS